jgi:hypothetical protein
MKIGYAILVTLGLYLGSVLISLLIHHNVVWYMIFLTTFWAAINSSEIELKRYRSGVGPVAYFFLCLLFWIIGFPWYLWMRHKILTGTAELKTNDPRCVRCEELIDSELLDCPRCGWRQPK